MALTDCLAVQIARLFEPETAHRLALGAIERGFFGAPPQSDDPALATRVFGLEFANPIGIAAGFDKNAEAVDGSLGLGGGFVEVGGVTPMPQAGNPRPRLFRLRADQAVINRMGFNNAGVAMVRERLRRFRGDGRWRTGIVAANLAKNRDSRDAAADYAEGAAALAPLVDLLVVNVSSPNTPGLRDLQGPDALIAILARVDAAITQSNTSQRPALLVKVAPDLTPADIADIAQVVMTTESTGRRIVAGLVIANTTLERPTSLTSPERNEAGGLSGRPLFELSTRVLGDFYRATGGRLPLVGVGGVASGADAYTKIRAGASLVQLYTALVYQGPGLLRTIKRELAALLRRDGFEAVSNAVGANHG
ncbi:MAG: quinone-dependent dihydroorotate dehydrogenase [Alphaproteobacteria bacterium]|nr:quinone-dependent dihydroorotate dehydrogenase [Alphaproteobacteria bacterium]